MSTTADQEPVAAGPEPVPADLLDNLVLTSFTVIALLSRTAAEHELSLTQLRMMAILRDRTPTMADLADFLGLERSSVSGLIDRAARRGLVQRTASPSDRRAVQVSLTPSGQRLAGQVTGEVAGLIAPMISTLAGGERKRLAQLLGKMLG
ncbi:MAG TPA: MarR family transcriptional regulator [Streptosporangiaceae bacterium]|jgi:DNA-binding MarR family transcriptional regulator